MEQPCDVAAAISVAVLTIKGKSLHTQRKLSEEAFIPHPNQFLLEMLVIKRFWSSGVGLNYNINNNTNRKDRSVLPCHDVKWTLRYALFDATE